MKKLILTVLAACLFAAFCAPTFAADTAESLGGQWSLERDSSSGNPLTQTLDVKDGKFTFTIHSADKKVVFFAKGKFTVQMHESIKIITFSAMMAGASAEEATATDDVRECVYTVDGDTMTVALDFDKQRGKSPRIEVYTRVKTGA
jgi:uncharacterized protein (TIGR03067 family)